jgi:hypothetical protein
VGFRVSVDTPAEPAGHAHQVVVVQFVIGTVMEPAPPRAEPTSRIAQRAVSIQHDAIYAVVAAVQQIRVLCAQLVGPHVRQDSNAASAMLPRRGHFFAAQSAKKRRSLDFQNVM